MLGGPEALERALALARSPGRSPFAALASLPALPPLRYRLSDSGPALDAPPLPLAPPDSARAAAALARSLEPGYAPGSPRFRALGAPPRNPV